MAKGEVKLFGTWSSPFVFRIKWVLKMKDVEYEFIEEDLANKSSLLIKYNPVHKKVPVLVHDGKPVVESLIILEYIDEVWKNNPILPKDPYERAAVRFWSKFGEEKCLPSIWQVFASKGKEQEEALARATENLKILETELKEKKFFGGDTIGLVDMTLGCIANMIGTIEEIIELKIIQEETFPLLSRWIENFSSFPALENNIPPRERMLTKYRMIHEGLFATKKN